MKKFAVIGYPISHSKSPALHEAGFNELSIDAEFSAIEVKPEDLASWISLNMIDYAGVAVTIPHKEKMVELVQKLSPAAKVIGAVNTLFWEHEVLHGTNTDCVGVLRALQTEVPELEGKKVLLLGAGGAARAALFALQTAGAKTVVWNRTAEKAVTLAEEFHAEAAESLTALNPDKFDIVINSTAVGLKEWKSLLPEDFWTPHHVAFDMVYDPLETRFLSEAAEAGARTVTGDQMLVHQALEQFHLWHDMELEPEVMGNAFFLADE
jgi:shikimate dehydrogenase